jgi:hypothetical protein
MVIGPPYLSSLFINGNKLFGNNSCRETVDSCIIFEQYSFLRNSNKYNKNVKEHVPRCARTYISYAPARCQDLILLIFYAIDVLKDDTQVLFWFFVVLSEASEMAN